MRRQEFREWSQTQPRRFERIDGVPVGMSPERIVHVRLKSRVWKLLEAAVEASGLPCEALGDGVTVEVGEDTDFEPDAVVQCGERLPGEFIVATSPIIVVEVLSLSTRADDFTRKFTGYFTVPTIQHYLIVGSRSREVIHHRRGDDGKVVSEVIRDGLIRFDPPGIAIGFADLYRGIDV